MKGFLKRDLYHIAASGKFYLVFVLVILALSAVSPRMASFLLLYVMFFAAALVLGLFAYDGQNGWEAYAAALPDGRRAQVAARYLAGLLLVGLVTAVDLMAAVLCRLPGQWALALLYTGMLLVYLDLLSPLTYRFGNKSRLVLLLIVGVIAGATGGLSTVGVLSGGLTGNKSPLLMAAGPLVVLGAVGQAISYRISVAIVAKKEF